MIKMKIAVIGFILMLMASISNAAIAAQPMATPVPDDFDTGAFAQELVAVIIAIILDLLSRLFG